MSLVFATKSKLTAIANAIRSKTGAAASMTLDGMASAIQTLVKPTGTLPITQNGVADVSQYAAVDVDVQGGGSALDFLMGRTPAGDVTLIPDGVVSYGAMCGRKNISKLTIDFTGTDYWFETNNGSTAYAPFMRNNIPVYHIISGNSLKIIQGYLFTSCTTSFVVVCRGTVGFNGMTQGAFRGNSGLTALDYTYGDEATGSIANNVFYGDSSFNTLIIRSNHVMPLANTGAFSNATQFRSGGEGGTLYVPQSLVSSYQSATNWSTILGYANNQIKSIESTHTDPNAPIDLTLYYADGTPIPTT